MSGARTRVLIVCARFPEPSRKGDQVRVRQQVELLAPDHDITVLTAGRPSSAQVRAELEALATVRTVPVGRGERLLGALAAGLRGIPLQVGWMTPGRVRRAAVQAAHASDVVIASTIRSLPGPLPAPTILDHIDALSANMRERSHVERRIAMRLGAQLEARLLAAHEARAARWLAAQIVISPVDALALPRSPPPVVIPIVLEASGAEAGEPPRDIDVIVTGNMRYPPNRDAAEWLAREIVPRLRRRLPAARVVIAGRAAGELALAGVEVASDVPDLTALLRRARVAAVPLRRGTGAPIKLLEALVYGAAVVCTPWVARAVDIDLDTAADADGFADAIEALLADEAARCARVAAGRAALRPRHPESVRAALTDLLARAAAQNSRCSSPTTGDSESSPTRRMASSTPGMNDSRSVES
jgi:glycosyltransferase involved in cell wall biosynthesis